MPLEDPILAASILVPLLMVKAWATFGFQGTMQRRAGKGVKEDWNRNDAPTAEDQETCDRWLRISQNDLENLPFGIFAMLFSAFATFSPFVSDGVRGFQIACQILYVCFRTAHTVVMALGIQPWRTVLYFLAQAMFVCMLLIIPIATFAAFRR